LYIKLKASYELFKKIEFNLDGSFETNYAISEFIYEDLS